MGVAAMLDKDARVVTRCGDCDDPLELNIRNGELLERHGVVQFSIPAARWWDNVGFT